MSSKKITAKAIPTNELAVSAETIPTFPIVGIGASAGGLAAFEAFFPVCPPTQTLTWLLCWYSI